MPKTHAPVVLVCDDLGDAPAPLCLEEFVDTLRLALPGLEVAMVPGICGKPAALERAMASYGPRRVVIGCRAVSRRRGELLASLRRAGAPAAGVCLVDLRPFESAGTELVFEQSVALVRAASAAVAAADISVAVRDKTSLSARGLSRRSLLRGGLPRHPLAVWRPDVCATGAACTACVSACPHGALRRESGRVIVDAVACTGCGVCVTACRSGAFSLPGAGLEELAVAAGVLVEYLRGAERGGGIAIACQTSSEAPMLGREWLTLRVPSVQMVTAGWLLQLVAAKTRVLVVACDDSECAKRAEILESFVRSLLADLARPDRGAAGPGYKGRVGPTRLELQLREPEATTLALDGLGALEPDFVSWRVEGPGSPLGLVRVDTSACTACGACAVACPTKALTFERDEAGSASLDFDPALCTACAACVVTCPESAVAVDAVLDGRALSSGRHSVVTRLAARCHSCGEVLDDPVAPVSLALGASHPFLARETTRLCANCRLGGHSVTAARTR